MHIYSTLVFHYGGCIYYLGGFSPLKILYSRLQYVLYNITMSESTPD